MGNSIKINAEGEFLVNGEALDILSLQETMKDAVKATEAQGKAAADKVEEASVKLLDAVSANEKMVKDKVANSLSASEELITDAVLKTKAEIAKSIESTDKAVVKIQLKAEAMITDSKRSAKEHTTERINKVNEEVSVKIANSAEDINVLNSIMTKVQYDSIVEQRKTSYAGSGVIDLSGYDSVDDWSDKINNNSMKTWKVSNDIPYSRKLILPGSRHSGQSTYNVNGHYLDLSCVNWDGPHNQSVSFAEFEQPSRTIVMTNTVVIPDYLEPKTLLVFNDRNRELIENGEFNENVDHWTDQQDNGVTASWDEDNTRLKITTTDDAVAKDVTQYVKLLNGVTYILSVGDFTDTDIILTEAGSNVKHIQPNTTIEFTASTYDYRIILRTEQGKTAYADNISLKQKNEAKFVVTKRLEKNLDIRLFNDNIEAISSLSRSDLMFIETWRENVIEKNTIYPFGAVQYLGDEVEGVAGLLPGDFFGKETYSLFGEWQEPDELVGKAYKWDMLSNEDKVKLAGNPIHNIYIDGKDVIQVRYRVRVIKGMSNKFNFHDTDFFEAFDYNKPITRECTLQGNLVTPFPTTALSRSMHSSNSASELGIQHGTFYSQTETSMPEEFDSELNHFIHGIPLALVQRRNEGVYHPVYNIEGCAKIYHDGSACMFYEVPGDYISSIADCFNGDKIATVDRGDPEAISTLTKLENDDDDATRYISTGLLDSKMSGRMDGFYNDQVANSDVEDLRMFAIGKDNEDLLHTGEMSVTGGEIRGKKGVTLTKVHPLKLRVHTAAWRDHNNFSFTIKRLDGVVPDRSNYESVHFKPGTKVKIIGSFGNMIDFTAYGTGMQWPHPNDGGSVYLYLNNTITANRKTDFPFEAGEILTLITEEEEVSGGQNHNTEVSSFTFGDPRKLSGRVRYVTTGEEQKVNIDLHTYIKDNDNFYRSLKVRGEIDLNAEDFTDEENWKSLGTNGDLGGYPDSWTKYGINTTSTFTGTDGKLSTYLNRWRDKYHGYKLQEKYSSLVKGVCVFGNGDTEVFSVGNANDLNKFETGHNSTKEDILNSVYWNALDERYDEFALFTVYFNRAVSSMSISGPNVPVLKLSDTVILNGTYNHSGRYVPEMLSGKANISTGESRLRLNSGSTYYKSGDNTTQILTVNTDIGESIKHDRIFDIVNPIDLEDKVKFFTYLAEESKRAKLQYVFKEVVRSVQTKDVHYDTGAININIDGSSTDFNINKTVNTSNRDNVIEIRLSSLDYNVGLEIAYKVENEWKEGINLAPYLVYHVNGYAVFQIPDTSMYHQAVRIISLGSDNDHADGVYITRVRFMRRTNAKVSSYELGSFGDDSEFRRYSNVRPERDLNGTNVLAGNKKVYLPYFIK